MINTNVHVPLFALVVSLLGGPKPEPTTPSMLKPGLKIVAIGDSITFEDVYNRYMDACFAQQYPELHVPKIINKGISGQMSGDLLARFDKDVVAQNPDVVLIYVGTNDVLLRLKSPDDPANLSAFKTNIAQMVDKAQAANIKVILISPAVLEEKHEKEGNLRLPAYIETERAIAESKHAAFIDLSKPFWQIIDQYRPANLRDPFITRDGIHMSALGNAVIALSALRALGASDVNIMATEVIPRRWKYADAAIALGGFGAGVMFVLLVWFVAARRHRKISLPA